jgi:pre-mRNA-processing factor 17
MASLVGANYDSSDDESEKPTTTFTSATKLVVAPEVNIEVWSFNHQQRFLLN